MEKEWKLLEFSWFSGLGRPTYTKGTPETQKFNGGSFLVHGVEGGVVEVSGKKAEKWKFQIKELSWS